MCIVCGGSSKPLSFSSLHHMVEQNYPKRPTNDNVVRNLVAGCIILFCLWLREIRSLEPGADQKHVCLVSWTEHGDAEWQSGKKMHSKLRRISNDNTHRTSHLRCIVLQVFRAAPGPGEMKQTPQVKEVKRLLFSRVCSFFFFLCRSSKDPQLGVPQGTAKTNRIHHETKSSIRTTAVKKGTVHPEDISTTQKKKMAEANGEEKWSSYHGDNTLFLFPTAVCRHFPPRFLSSYGPLSPKKKRREAAQQRENEMIEYLYFIHKKDLIVAFVAHHWSAKDGVGSLL
eukprot:gene10645-7393_t